MHQKPWFDNINEIGAVLCGKEGLLERALDLKSEDLDLNPSFPTN